jgi:ATP-dependent Clp protease ATP-binding subunit ClpA
MFLPHLPRRAQHFTRQASTVLQQAQHEAISAGNSRIGPEHLLLGLLGSGGQLVTTVLHLQGVVPKQLRQVMEKRIRLNDYVDKDTVGLTLEAKRIIELGVGYAKEHGHTQVDTMDLLLGLLAGDDNVAAAALQRSGVTLEKTQQAVLTV